MSANTAELKYVERTTINRQGRQYAVLYQVTTTEASDQSLAALMAPGMPMRGDYFVAGDSSDTAAFVDSYDIRLTDADGSRRSWSVVVHYISHSNLVEIGSDPTRPPSRVGYDFPWDEPTEVQSYGRRREVPLTMHYSNPSTGATEPLRNSAGDFYDDEFFERAHPILQLRKKYHYTQFSHSYVEGFIDYLNDAAFFGQAAGVYRMMEPRWSLQYTGEGIPFYDVHYEFHGDLNGWNGKPKIDTGYWYIDHSDSDRVKRFKDDDFLPLSGKGLLDGTGDALDKWAMPVYYPEGGINRFPLGSFGSMNIPTSISQVLQGL